MAMKLRTITVARLRSLLEGEDDDALVLFTADYGDHCRTPQALPLRGELDQVEVRESAYSVSRYRIVTDEDEDFGDRDRDGNAPQQYLLVR